MKNKRSVYKFERSLFYLKKYQKDLKNYFAKAASGENLWNPKRRDYIDVYAQSRKHKPVVEGFMEYRREKEEKNENIDERVHGDVDSEKYEDEDHFEHTWKTYTSSLLRKLEAKRDLEVLAAEENLQGAFAWFPSTDSSKSPEEIMSWGQKERKELSTGRQLSDITTADFLDTKVKNKNNKFSSFEQSDSSSLSRSMTTTDAEDFLFLLDATSRNKRYLRKSKKDKKKVNKLRNFGTLQEDILVKKVQKVFSLFLKSDYEIVNK